MLGHQPMAPRNRPSFSSRVVHCLSCVNFVEVHILFDIEPVPLLPDRSEEPRTT